MAPQEVHVSTASNSYILSYPVCYSMYYKMAACIHLWNVCFRWHGRGTKDSCWENSAYRIAPSKSFKSLFLLRWCLTWWIKSQKIWAAHSRDFRGLDQFFMTAFVGPHWNTFHIPASIMSWICGLWTMYSFPLTLHWFQMILYRTLFVSWPNTVLKEGCFLVITNTYRIHSLDRYNL